MTSWLRLVGRWESFQKACFIRYEDLMDDPRRELRRTIAYFGWDVSEFDLGRIVRRQEAEKASSRSFNTGKSQRYRWEMTPSEIKASTNAFKRFLIDHGYDMNDC